jgi:GTPase SAR1 family protein
MRLGVGKSCLLKSFMGDPFKGVYTSTIGVDFEIKPVQIDGRTVNLQIWVSCLQLHIA